MVGLTPGQSPDFFLVFQTDFFNFYWPLFNNVYLLVSVISSPYGCREIHGMANEKNRNDTLTVLMQKYPDWDWDYWMAQI